MHTHLYEELLFKKKKKKNKKFAVSNMKIETVDIYIYIWQQFIKGTS